MMENIIIDPYVEGNEGIWLEEGVFEVELIGDVESFDHIKTQPTNLDCTTENQNNRDNFEVQPSGPCNFETNDNIETQANELHCTAENQNNRDDFELQPYEPCNVETNDDIETQANDVNYMSEDEENRKTRSRVARPETWKKNKRTASVLSGLPHINKKGKFIPEKIVKTTDCECQFLCRHAISVEQQRTLFDDYRSLQTTFEQRSFLASMIMVNSVQRRTTADPTKIRSRSVTYMLKNEGGDLMRVCQRFFCNTFGISKKVIVNIAEKMSPSTGRYKGGHGNEGRAPKNITPQRKIDKVNTFIRNFPKLPSHYSRKNSSYLYIEPGLNLTKLYDLYKEALGNSDPVSKNVFSKIFNSWEPRIVFHTPLKDQCTTCNNPDDSTEYKEHLERKIAIRAMKTADKAEAEGNSKMMYATFDLQAVLVLPYVQDAQVYYSRKVGLYNFTIFDSRKEVVCNVFDEANGAKSSTEIASCLYAYLESLPTSIEHVVFYCDTASGQNRNQYVVATLLYAVHHINNIATIDLKFLESGHSYMECDSVHSRIEKTRKKLRLFTPNDYENVMRSARSNPKPYEVKRWQYSDFYDIRKLTEEVMVNPKIDSNRQPVNWLKVKWFRVRRNSTVVSFKYGDVQGDFLQFDARRSKKMYRTRKTPSGTSLPSPPALLPINDIQMEKGFYSQPLPISILKKRDLMNLITKGIIPTDFSSYYNSFTASKDVKDTATWITIPERNDTTDADGA